RRLRLALAADRDLFGSNAVLDQVFAYRIGALERQFEVIVFRTRAVGKTGHRDGRCSTCLRGGYGLVEDLGTIRLDVELVPVEIDHIGLRLYRRGSCRRGSRFLNLGKRGEELVAASRDVIRLVVL